jgi:membrane-associated HD superfamily phosphohydrolase
MVARRLHYRQPALIGRFSPATSLVSKQQPTTIPGIIRKSPRHHGYLSSCRTLHFGTAQQFQVRHLSSPPPKDPPTNKPKPSSDSASIFNSNPTDVRSNATNNSTTPTSNYNHATVAAQQQLQRLQRAVTDLNLGDQLSVMLISLFTFLILASPYILQQVKKLNQDDYDDFWKSMGNYDVIDDFTKLARTEWGKVSSDADDETADGEHRNNNNALDVILQDVLQSHTLQQVAQQFVIGVISSDVVKVALQRLLAELFSNLIQDPETLAQIIQVLHRVIQDETMKQALQELVIQLVDEPSVKASLVELLQRLAREEPVPTALTDLLKQSAHATLNDADILDHR